MTEKELEMMLSQKETPAPRKNVSLVLSPDVTRNAMRLKKRRRDRLQTILFCAAALVFLMAAGGILFYLMNAENPESLLRPILTTAAGGMGLVLLLSPALAWFADDERRNEA